MRGFTLLELLVVLLLLGMALGLVVPRLERAFSPPMKPFPEQLEEFLSRARERALVEKKSYLVLIDPEERCFFLCRVPYDPDEPRIQEKLEVPEVYEVKQEGLLEIKGLAGILFLANGTCSGGEIELIDREFSRQTLLRIPQALFYVERRLLTP